MSHDRNQVFRDKITTKYQNTNQVFKDETRLSLGFFIMETQPATTFSPFSMHSL
jgi:hypothetical protein